MPRHNPTTVSADDGHGRHERRLELASSARTRRRTRRLTAAPDEGDCTRLVTRPPSDVRDLRRQLADWRTEPALLP